MVGILVSFWDGLYYSGVMLVAGSVNFGGCTQTSFDIQKEQQSESLLMCHEIDIPKHSIELMYLATNFLCRKNYTQFCWLIDQPHYINGINYHGTLRAPPPRTPLPQEIAGRINYWIIHRHHPLIRLSLGPQNHEKMKGFQPPIYEL